MYKNILVMTDFSEDAAHATEVAAGMAKQYNADLTILHVAHDESQLPIYLSSIQYDEIKKLIDKEVKKHFEGIDKRIPSLKGINNDRLSVDGAV